MKAQFHDGRSAAAHQVDVRVEDRALMFQAPDGGTERWVLATVTAEALGETVRVASGEGLSARLIFSTVVWREAMAEAGDPVGRRERGGARRLAVILGGAAMALALLIFVGIPAASGPLASRTPPELERKMGDSLEAQLQTAFRPCSGQAGQVALSAFGDRLEGGMQGRPFDIRVRAVKAPFPNAFALPGGAVLITDDLIRMARTPDELSAVIAHEVAHVEQRHAMQAVWRSFGFGMILDAVVGGGSGAGQQAVLLMGSFSSLRHSRAAEAQADRRGQEMLQGQGLSSLGMAGFFEQLGQAPIGATGRRARELASSHPDSIRRAAESRVRGRPGAPAFSAADWAQVQAVCAQDKPIAERLWKRLEK